MTIKNRLAQLEKKQNEQPFNTPDRVIIHSDLPEGTKPTDVITIIEHIEDDKHEQPTK